MKTNSIQLLLFLFFLFIFIILCNGQNKQSNFTTRFVLDLYDPNDNLTVRYMLEYDESRKLYTDDYKLHNTYAIKHTYIYIFFLFLYFL